MTPVWLDKILPWIVVAIGCAVFVSLGAVMWSRQTTIELSRTGWAVIVATSLAGAALTAWSYARNSSSRFGVADQVNLRERDRPTWLRGGVGATLGMGALVAGLSALSVYKVIPHLRGEQSRRTGTVQRLIVNASGTISCRHRMIVRFDDDSEAKICTDNGWRTRTIMPDAASLQVGDQVVVSLNTTSLGVSADLVHDIR
jgi:hypothetical protein